MTGVQTCALPILWIHVNSRAEVGIENGIDVEGNEWRGFVDGVTDKNNTPDCKDEITLMIDFRYHSFYDDEIKDLEILD